MMLKERISGYLHIDGNSYIIAFKSSYFDGYEATEYITNVLSVRHYAFHLIEVQL